MCLLARKNLFLIVNGGVRGSHVSHCEVAVVEATHGWRRMRSVFDLAQLLRDLRFASDRLPRRLKNSPSSPTLLFVSQLTLLRDCNLLTA
jgi:hypothetical protein